MSGIMRSVRSPKPSLHLGYDDTTPHNRGLRIISKRREDPEHQLAGGGSGVDRRALAGQHTETDIPFRQVVYHIHQVAQVTAESVELPNNQSVSRS